MNSLRFEDVLDLALQLPPTQQARLIIYLAAATQETLAAHTDAPDEEAWIAQDFVSLLHIEHHAALPPDGDALLAVMGMDES